MTTPEMLDAIWVISDITPDGTYVVTVHASQDVAFTLDREQALAYVATVMDASCRAEFDAAVFRQQRAIGMDDPLAASVIGDLRRDRPPLQFDGPLTLEPFVTAAAFAPAIHILVNGESVGQWSVADARDHALNVLVVLAGVDLDAAYHRYLRGSIGLDDARARALVCQVSEYRKTS